MKKMTKCNEVMHALAMLVANLLCVVLCVCANTTSSTLIYQPKSPDELEKYSRVK